MADQAQRGVRCGDVGVSNLWPPRGCQHACAVALQSVLPLALPTPLSGAEVRTGGCTVVPGDFGRAAASNQRHRVWRPPAQHVVASHPTVLLAHQQWRRLVEAVAPHRDILIQKDASKITIAAHGLVTDRLLTHLCVD